MSTGTDSALGEPGAGPAAAQIFAISAHTGEDDLKAIVGGTGVLWAGRWRSWRTSPRRVARPGTSGCPGHRSER